MNQILSVEMPSKKKKNEGKKINIKSIIIFFCIILLIFGILMIGIGIYSKLKNDESEGNEFVKSKPRIEAIQEELSRLQIDIKSEKNIAKVVYKWDDGEETVVNGNDQNSMQLEIKVPVGNHIVSITATDIDNVSETFTREYVGAEEYNPKISLIHSENMFKLVCESDTVIKQISYYYDDKAESTKPINNAKGEVSIGVIPGEHNLTIKVVDERNREYKENHKVSAPNISVVTDGKYFIITGNDTTGLKKAEITFNGEKSEKELNSNDYETKLKLEDGENRVIIKLTNGKGITYTKRVKWEKTN